MHSFRFSELSSKEQMKLTKGSVIPRPIAWITTRNSDGSHNLAPFSYFNMLSSSVLAVSFIRKQSDGPSHQKDTAVNLLREQEAVVQITDASVISQVDWSSAEFAPGISEVEETGLTLTPSLAVETAGIAEAKIRLEVKLEQQLELMTYEGDAVEADLLLLRVEAVHISDDAFDAEKGYVLHDVLSPLARLGGPYYASIQTVDGFERQF